MNSLKHLNPCHEGGNRVIVIGNGGREDAIRWKLQQHGHCIVESLADLTIVGPEVPLVDGIVDRHGAKHIVGPNRVAAKLEGSKLFAKQFMTRHDIPTARYMSYVRSPDGMNAAILDNMDRPTNEYPLVVKEDGLCAGKGVHVCKTDREFFQLLPQLFTNNIHKSKSNKILVEEFIAGEEVSCFVLTDGYNYNLLPFVRDYKRAYNGNEGPNTGGMGATTYVPFMTERLEDKIRKTIVEPTLYGCREDGMRYTGILYIGLMIKDGNPYVIEYNVRFGDPECQAIMMIWDQDIYEPMYQSAHVNTDNPKPVIFSNDVAVTVTLCSGGYPSAYETGYQIHGLDTLPEDVIAFRAGVEEREDGNLYTSGGRVLNITARAETQAEALAKVYAVIGEHGVHFENMHYRTDIGTTNEKIHATNKASQWNQRRRGRRNTDECRTRFKNHSHNRRASLLSNRRG